MPGTLRAVFRLFRLLGHLVVGWWRVSHLGRMDEQARLRVVCDWLAEAVEVLGVTVEVRGFERLESLDGGSLWLPNHISWLDIPLLGGVRTGTVFLSKSEIRRWPMIGRLARLAGTEFIERGRGSAAAAEAVERGLEHGRQMVVFAEGTTTDGWSVRRFHARLLDAAVCLEQPVVPIALRYFDAAGNRTTVPAFIDNETLWPSLWRVLSSRGLRGRIDVLEPIQPRAGDTRGEVARRAHRAVAEAVGAPKRS